MKLAIAILWILFLYRHIKFIYSEKATKFCKLFTLLLTGTTYDKGKVESLQNFVAFSEYMNFKMDDGLIFLAFLEYLKITYLLQF